VNNFIFIQKNVCHLSGIFNGYKKDRHSPYIHAGYTPTMVSMLIHTYSKYLITVLFLLTEGVWNL